MGRLGFSLFSLILVIILGYGGLVWFANEKVETVLNQAVADVEGLNLDYGDIWVDLGDGTVTMTDTDAALPWGQRLKADEIIVHAFDERHPVPHFLRAQANGLVIHPTDAALVGLTLSEPIKGDLLVDYVFEPETQALHVRTLTFDAGEVGRATLSGTITQLDLSAFRVERLVGSRMKELQLTFTNGTFMERFLNNTAMALGASTADASSMVAAELSVMADHAARTDNGVAEDALRGLGRFVKNPDTLSVSATPAEPVPFLYLFMGRDMYDNLRLMQVSVVANDDTNSN